MKVVHNTSEIAMSWVYGGKQKRMLQMWWSLGRVFQSLGAAAANDRSATDTSLDEGTKRSSEVKYERYTIIKFELCFANDLVFVTKVSYYWNPVSST